MTFCKFGTGHISLWYELNGASNFLAVLILLYDVHVLI